MANNESNSLLLVSSRPIWLTRILDILLFAGIRVRFFRMYGDGQEEVCLVLGGVKWNDLFQTESKPK